MDQEEQMRKVLQKFITSDHKEKLELKFPKVSNKRIEFVNYGFNKMKTVNKLFYMNIDNTIHICSKCLSILPSENSLAIHFPNCKIPFVPLYSESTGDNVDFHFSKIVDLRNKQNLCRISMLFLKSKTLFFEVENYDFYIVFNQEVFGYFSVCKNGEFSLNCFTVFPCFQGKGWGTLLLDFSNMIFPKGIELKGAEKPYSKKAIICFRKYWKHKVIGAKTIRQISCERNLSIDDAILGLEQNGFDLKTWKLKNSIGVKKPRILKYRIAKSETKTDLSN